MKLSEELDKAKAYLILKDSEAGEYILDELKEDAESITRDIIGRYKTDSHIELITKIARLEVILKTIEDISESDKRVKILKDEYEKNNQENND